MNYNLKWREYISLASVMGFDGIVFVKQGSMSSKKIVLKHSGNI